MLWQIKARSIILWDSGWKRVDDSARPLSCAPDSEAPPMWKHSGCRYSSVSSHSLFFFFVVICFFLLQHSLKTPEDVLRRPQIRRCYRKNDRASLLSLTAVNQPVMIDYFQRCSRGCTPPLLGNCQKKNSAEIFSLFEMEESLRQSGCHGPVLVS